MEKILPQYRQGDVLLISVKKLPKGALVKGDLKTILAHGEVTGHTHRLEAPTKKSAPNVLLEGIKRHLEICFKLPLVHEEHQTIEIPAGRYEQREQLTWDYLAEMGKKVID